MRSAIIASLVVLAACSPGGGGEESAEGLSECEQAMQAAAEVDEMADTVEDLDPAVRACDSFAEWSAASDKFPDALDGAPARLFAQNRCAGNPDLASEELCQEVGAPGS